MTGPVTIGDLFHDGKLLWWYCRNCGRERDIDPVPLGCHLNSPSQTLEAA